MELHEFSELMKGMKAPADAGTAPAGARGSLEDLIARLKQEDSRDRRRARRMMLFFVAAGVIYALIFTLTWILPPDGPAAVSRLVLGLFTVLFLAIALISRRTWRDLSSKDYARPVAAYLSETERRYRFIDARQMILGVPILLVLTFAAGLGWMNACGRYLPQIPSSGALTAFVVFWAAVLVFALFLGRREWKRRKAPLWRALRNMSDALGHETTDPGAP